MKVFISADIEGTNGIADWDETEYEKPRYAYFAAKMTDEVGAVCWSSTSFLSQALTKSSRPALGRFLTDGLS